MSLRLEKIKLAGFKSFVDPTVLELPSPLVAVVGPNGCGKSNIIDAIRWVMGESSAKNLRGESMTDVIFNGSSTRKPVGQASIELVFDNSDGKLGGEYARFAQISVRREVGRDGQSNYFLNGTRCRRKDVTDVFLGTGLGPRSYAIIEQGMISRVIEARPEELRAFLEEAAGISLYRKRRHETEIRMRHTRENLDRLNDIRQELEKQLERLKRQSESAGRYKQYKEEQDRLEAELSALRWQVLNVQLQERANSIRSLSTGLEEKLALRTHLELDLEKQRQHHTEKMDAWKKEQGQYYDIGTHIARIEQTLQHHREREEALEKDLLDVEQNFQQTTAQSNQDQVRLSGLKEELAILSPDLEAARLVLEQSEAVRLQAEEGMRHWNQSFETFQQDAEKPQRTAEVEKAKIEQLEKQSASAKTQFERLQREQSEINIADLERHLAALEQDRLDQERAGSTAAQLNGLSLELTAAREILGTESTQLDALRSRLQILKGRRASLEALQQAALGKTNASISGWLESAGVLENPRLGEVLRVESGFERAVETVLGSALEAVCVSGMDAIAGLLEGLSEGHLSFIDQTHNSAAFATHPNHSDLLIHKVSGELSAASLLSGIYVADNLSDALQRQKNLKSGESIVTRDGVWLGGNWLKVYRGTEGHAGILARESELKELGLTLAALQDQIQTSESDLKHHQETIAVLEQKRDSLHAAQQEESRLLNEISAKISAERTRLEHIRARLARLLTESAEQKQKVELAEEEIALSRMSLQTALDAMEAYAKKRVALQTERDNLRDLLREASQNASAAKEKAHVLALSAQTLSTQQQAIEEGLNRLLKQQQAISERRTALQQQLQALQAPKTEMRQSLEEYLEKRMVAEDALNFARTVLDELEQTLRTLEKQRHSLEEEAQGLRETLERLRMEWQAIEVRCQTVQENLAQTGKTLEQIVQAIPPEATESDWALALEQVTKRIERLGAINLAAIEEFESESERKNYLDAQHADLTEALQTLEEAIRKIDKETRARFKETFEQVNTEFQALFPRLFGGGEAILELVGEDLLESGVTVTARPPGKRNSSIHLLSGGEKALTAVAMVFAIFQLNPAPFCLLDEVDAPLDDANVGRFCELVKQLSETVQFVFVTHNKLAMEMAHHLVGVTMKEPGVSRLVSVDVEQAMELVVAT